MEDEGEERVGGEEEGKDGSEESEGETGEGEDEKEGFERLLAAGSARRLPRLAAGDGSAPVHLPNVTSSRGDARSAMRSLRDAAASNARPGAPTGGEVGEAAGEQQPSAAAFGAPRIRSHIGGYAPVVASDANDYMAAVLQCVASRLLQSAGDAAAASEAGRIEPQHVWQAQQEAQLDLLVRHAQIDAGESLEATASMQAGAEPEPETCTPPNGVHE